jgi:crossover junction endodeoxyribonuclease RuvC
LNIIAIDPGIKGAIAIRCEGKISAMPMPIAGKHLDAASIVQLLNQVKPAMAVMEKVTAMPGQGVTSTFTFGMGYGLLQGILAGLGVPVELVTPQAWKKEVLAGSAKDKAAAIAYCRRVYPGVALVLPRCRVPHDGIADALCILTYGMRKFW